MTNGLPLLNKLLYTSDMIGGQAVAQTRNLWLLFFLAPPRGEGDAAVTGLSLGPIDIDARVLVGAVLTAGRLIEAFDDPIIGWWSDRTKSRWGRRLPFVVFSTPFWAIFFMLLWFSPVEGASFVNALWVFVILELFFLSNTMSIGPYESLLPEVARSHRDRMSIVAMQFYFGVLGAVLGLVLSGVVQDTWGFQVMGVLVGALGLGFRFLGVGGVWRHAPRDTPPAQMPLKGAFLATLANKQFLYFLPTFVLYQLSTTMTLGWMPFFVSAILGAENEGTMTSALTGTALVGMMVAVFAMWKLSHTKGKQWVYSLCLLGTAIILPFMFFVGFVPGVPILAQGIVVAFLVGLPMGGVNLMPRAITADITDYDEIRTGMRREAMFFTTQNLFEKVGSSFSALLLALILLLGETADDPLGIRLLGPVAGAIAFIGYWVFKGYRLPSTVTPESVREAGL